MAMGMEKCDGCQAIFNYDAITFVTQTSDRLCPTCLSYRQKRSFDAEITRLKDELEDLKRQKDAAVVILNQWEAAAKESQKRVAELEEDYKSVEAARTDFLIENNELKERIKKLEWDIGVKEQVIMRERTRFRHNIIKFGKRAEAAEARAVRWEGKGVAPNDGETIVALCDVGGRRVFRPIIYVAGYGWKKTAFHYAIKRWCSHEALAKSAGVE